MRWQQKNRDDSYSPSDDLLAAPATFKAEKGGTQVVRIALNRKLDGNENAYRIFVEEVPVSREVAPNSLKTVVSMAIPAFVAPQSGPLTKGQATLKATHGKDRQVQIELANIGKANLKLLEWTVSGAKDEPLLKVPSAAYVLAGNTLSASYRLPMEVSGTLKLTLRTDRGTFSAPIVR
jgi:fimbrial chaperone protein